MLHFSRFHPAVTANSPQWNPDQAAIKKPSWYEFHQEPKPPRKKVKASQGETPIPERKRFVEAVSGVLGSALLDGMYFRLWHSVEWVVLKLSLPLFQPFFEVRLERPAL
jgi:hypothetical protein